MAKKSKKKGGLGQLSLWSERKKKTKEQHDRIHRESGSQTNDLYIDQAESRDNNAGLKNIKVPNKFAPISESRAKAIIGKQSHAAEIAQLLESKTRKKKVVLQKRRKKRRKLIAALKTPLKALVLIGLLFVGVSWCKRNGFQPANSKFTHLLQIMFATAQDELRKIDLAYDESLDADAWTVPNMQSNAFDFVQAIDPEARDCQQILAAKSTPDLKSSFIRAECAYVNGYVRDGYEALALKSVELKQESLLLYVMLLLKRFEFSKAEKLLAGKCSRDSTSSPMFFPCVADALRQVIVNGKSDIKIPPKNENSNNPYAAIYWLVEFLKTGSTDVRDNTIQNAIAIASAAERPAALAFIYEVLASHIYLKGSKSRFAQLFAQAKRSPRLDNSVAMQWVIVLARSRAAEYGSGRPYSIVETITNGSVKLCDNMNFLAALGFTGIRDGRSRDVLEELRGVHTCYQERGWRNSAGLQAVSEWKIRIDIAANKYKKAAKLLRKHKSNYGESRFYHHYYGALRLKIFKHKADLATVADSLNKSILTRESWEHGYCLALLHFYKGRYAAALDHVAKVKSSYSKSEYGSWLFMLENEIFIYHGEIDKAISNLISHLSANHSSFKAYELLIRAYRRKNESAKAAEIQKVFNTVIRSVPYYSTEEGARSPIGALALI